MKTLSISFDLTDGAGKREGCRTELELCDDFDGAALDVGMKAAVAEIDYLNVIQRIKRRQDNGT